MLKLISKLSMWGMTRSSWMYGSLAPCETATSDATKTNTAMYRPCNLQNFHMHAPASRCPPHPAPSPHLHARHAGRRRVLGGRRHAEQRDERHVGRRRLRVHAPCSPRSVQRGRWKGVNPRKAAAGDCNDVPSIETTAARTVRRCLQWNINRGGTGRRKTRGGAGGTPAGPIRGQLLPQQHRRGGCRGSWLPCRRSAATALLGRA